MKATAKLSGSFLLIVLLVIIFGFKPLMNPNPGQLTTNDMRRMGRSIEVFNLTKFFAEEGHPWAQFQLAMHYASGDGVSQDDKLAVHWLSLASMNYKNNRWSEGEQFSLGPDGPNAENPWALVSQHFLAESYRFGRAHGRDLVSAYLYEKNVLQALAAVEASALTVFRQNFLGGTTKSNVKSQVEERFNSLRDEMSAEDISRAEELSADWRPTIIGVE